jgi:L-alanine-DL-glutamate epimerase-like enolase superfamily enzyme
MKITAVRAIPVRVPKVRPFRSALGVNQEASAGIVLIDTDEGIQGLGEIVLIWHGNGAPLCDLVNSLLAEHLVGADPLAIAALHDRMGRVLQFGQHTLTARAGIDMALYDIAGKALGTPVYNLLGGRYRDRIELSMSVHMDEVPVMVDHARAYAERGFRTVKVKVGIDPVHDLAVVGAIREALPDIGIRVDANMGWAHPKEALRLIRRLSAFEILSVEQPLPPRDLEGLAYLREHSEVPIMVDESVWGPADAWDVIRHRAADIINVYVSEAGGLYPAARILHAAEMAGILGCIGSMPEFGIGTAAQAHLAAAVPNVRHPSDVAGFLYQGDDLILEELAIRDGFFHISDRPGLGVTLDVEALNRYRVDQ